MASPTPKAITSSSSQPSSGSNPQQQAGLDASRLTYNFTTTPSPVPDEVSANRGDLTVATDHMITATWDISTGWARPELKPYGPLQLSPAASCLHYATECFEGLKAYRGYDGKLRLFRPDHNTTRMRLSAHRVSLPTFDPTELAKLIKILCAVDCPRWLPQDRTGSFLYIRPTMIGTHAQLGVQSPKQALLYIMLAFIPRLDSPAGGMRLLTSPQDTVRSWVGGFGYAKVGANYGPSLLAGRDALREGFHQTLWLYGQSGECTEAGGSNFFVVWRRRGDGKKEVVTAPLDDKIILDGVTRRSCLEILRVRMGGEVEVTEHKYTIGELFEAHEQGRILEAFVTGTAYFICPVSQIQHNGKNIHIPVGHDGKPGDITGRVKGWIHDIMYGRQQHPWGVVIPEGQAL
ncbi:branched-chain amino acid aminotransferase II [Aspergillus pseudoustus]|uniref:Branched-chain-amino-acid aminotransferase n=1 Tax=Aspergillus pseudoustus TaxID=1810923 RepID=A0ABR4JJF8_9EURO